MATDYIQNKVQGIVRAKAKNLTMKAPHSRMVDARDAENNSFIDLLISNSHDPLMYTLSMLYNKMTELILFTCSHRRKT